MSPLDTTGTSSASKLTYKLADEGFWDMTIGAGVEESGPKPPASVQEAVRTLLPAQLRGFLPQGSTFGTTTFELPSVAFAYERGWRQGFAAVGFPGPDEEYAMATSKLTGARGGTLLDASCGSGLFTRRFVRAGDYRHVVALDFSESMLQQAKAYFEEENMDTNAVTLVRADIARMPFLSNSLDGVHAGAAIHCWPSPKAAVAEIARVLKPGAVFCGTTFLNPQIPFVDEEMQSLASSLMRGVTSRGGFNYWDKRALKDVFEACGLEDIEFEVRRQFIFFSMRKPAAAVAPVQAASAPPPPAAPSTVPSSDYTVNSPSPQMPPRMWTPESN